MEALDPVQHVYGGYTSAGYMTCIYLPGLLTLHALDNTIMSLEISSVLGNSL